MPQKDSQLQSAMASQGTTVPWGQKASERLYSVSIWQSPDHLLRAGGCSKKAESETEETKVKVRSAATTEVPSSSKELGDQIARLMAAVTRAEQGSCPASAPIAQGTGVMGEDEQTGMLLSTQAPTMVGLAWAKPLPPVALQLPTG